MSDAGEFWNARFSATEYVYGTEPNDFLKSQAHRFPANSKVLSIGEGEGRNASFLAGAGIQMHAIEASSEGAAKIAKLAADRGQQITVMQQDLNTYTFEENTWDGVVSIFCHLPSALSAKVLPSIVNALKPGGYFVMEVYTPRQLAYGTGGPKDSDMLYEPDDVRRWLNGLELVHFAEIERSVVEGTFHTGNSRVLQVVAQKPLVGWPTPMAGEGYIRHLDGGYYRRLGIGRDADDENALVVYAHVWPFEPYVWVRPQSEFPGRFTEVTEAEVVAAMKEDREEAGAAVLAAKALRRAKSSS
ncbi:DUF1653 domain-containing protein [Leeia sp. TBRC 13508]|uniref:DUF1653 domain-containing protein n=1 Tax=Leeia speluncae TaxID=2884804 RepID=A0ABS8D1F3_9NEIS|nr:DUF1653 domain-containing protein [Leeia speluncae]MCB6182026.1 DUF1653 domain-containing protein [Leeia speluncae]